MKSLIWSAAVGLALIGLVACAGTDEGHDANDAIEAPATAAANDAAESADEAAEEAQLTTVTLAVSGMT